MKKKQWTNLWKRLIALLLNINFNYRKKVGHEKTYTYLSNSSYLYICCR